jgi:hypothetical protein
LFAPDLIQLNRFVFQGFRAGQLVMGIKRGVRRGGLIAYEKFKDGKDEV